MKFVKVMMINFVLSVFLSGIAHATPSTTYWTPMTPDIQSYGVLHIGVDNYFSVARKTSDEPGINNSLPMDAGLTIGVLPFEKFQMEVGIDYLQPSDYPAYFNAKMGAPEGALGSWAPTLQVGIFNVGTHKNSAQAGQASNSTNQNIVYGVIGKTIPYVGRLSAGPYIGNDSVLKNGKGDKENYGFMVAFDRGFLPVKDKDGNEFNRIVLAADYASKKNAIGGGGVGLYYYFTKDISLLTGPVWFNDQDINGKWKWTIQLDINTQLFGGKK
ncbi:MAG: hypothetical protein NTW12_13575 [Deltaproteobacteria bacterium]|nr:hypothetical protein [Deltaproteobacteria bacterium]